MEGALLALALLALSPPARVVDDYGRALAVARARGAPIFVEAWAPW